MDLADLAARVDAINARYAEIYGFERDGDWVMLKLQEEVGELAQAWLAKTGRQRDRGLSPAEIEERFRLELADALGLLLVLARVEGVDLERAMDAKWLVWDRREHQRGDELDDGERALEGQALRGEAATRDQPAIHDRAAMRDESATHGQSTTRDDAAMDDRTTRDDAATRDEPGA